MENQLNKPFEIIRLHLPANSNQEADQQIKRQIRNCLLKFLHSDLKKTADRKQARALIQKQRINILDLVQKELQKAGFKYGVQWQWGNFAFPACRYRFKSGDYYLPAGNYEALRLVLGEGAGKNWFCVLFPALCWGELEEEAEENPDETACSSIIWDWLEDWW